MSQNLPLPHTMPLTTGDHFFLSALKTHSHTEGCLKRVTTVTWKVRDGRKPAHSASLDDLLK